MNYLMIGDRDVNSDEVFNLIDRLTTMACDMKAKNVKTRVSYLFGGLVNFLEIHKCDEHDKSNGGL